MKKFENITLKNLAVLIIDMQDKFIDTDEKRNLIPNQISIIHFCKENNVPIVVIEFDGYPETVENLKREINKISQDHVFTFKKRKMMLFL